MKHQSPAAQVHLAALALFMLLIIARAEPVVLAQSPSFMPQEQDISSWVEVAPPGEGFRVRMPATPASRNFNKRGEQAVVTVRQYTVTEKDGFTYSVWSLKREAQSIEQAGDASILLDDLVEFYWETLMLAERKAIAEAKGRPGEDDTRLTYRYELKSKGAPAREYLMYLGMTKGVIHFYSLGQNRGYIVAASKTGFLDPVHEQFLNSFTLTTAATAEDGFGGDTGEGTAVGGGIGGGQPNDNRIFNTREVDTKALIRSRPEPQYTEQARKYGVTGTVVLRAVFSVTGEMTNIRIIRRLPHGLTEKAIKAARQMRFTPAVKDGRPVSQYIQIEYNFNLY